MDAFFPTLVLVTGLIVLDRFRFPPNDIVLIHPRLFNFMAELFLAWVLA